MKSKFCQKKMKLTIIFFKIKYQVKIKYIEYIIKMNFLSF